MTFPGSLFTQTPVTVSTRLKPTPNGTTYADPVTRSFYVEDETKLVRDANGVEVVSQTTVYAKSGDSALFLVGSDVTVGGRETTVVAVRPRLIGMLGLDHIEVSLA